MEEEMPNVGAAPAQVTTAQESHTVARAAVKRDRESLKSDAIRLSVASAEVDRKLVMAEVAATKIFDQNDCSGFVN